MRDRMSVTLVHEGDGPTDGDIVCRLETLDPSLSGHKAKFALIADVDVQDGRPVNGKGEVYSQDFQLSSVPLEVRIPRESIRAYTYFGQNIHVYLRSLVTVDDSVLFDTKVSQDHEIRLGLKPEIGSNTKGIIEPKDAYDFFKNLRAIPAHAQAFTVVLTVVGVAIAVIIALVGVHDFSVGSSSAWFSTSVTDEEEPLVVALMGSGGIGIGIWFMIRKQLRRYMLFHFRRLPTLRPGRTYSVNDLIRGRSRVPLHDATLRIVACNMEKGQYRRGSGTDERTVSFSEPIRGVILYEKTVSLIEARTPVAQYFDGPVDFTPMFSALYPPFLASSTHGIAVHWEVQLLHPEYVDQELVGPDDNFTYEDFLKDWA